MDVNTVLNLISTLLQSIVWLWFIRSFTGIKNNTKELLYYFGSMVLMFFLRNFLNFNAFGYFILFQQLDAVFIIAFLFLVVKLLFKQPHIISALTSMLIMFAIVWGENVLSPVLFFINKKAQLNQNLLLHLSSVLFLISDIIILIVLKRTLKPQEISKYQSRYLIFTLSPILLLILLMRSLINFQMLTLGQENYQITNSLAFVITFNIFSLIICIVSLFSFKKLLHYSRLMAELSLQQKYIEQAKLRYEHTKAFRHDLNNHLNVIGGLLKRNQHEQAERYLNSIYETANKLSFDISGGNSAVDVLLSEKLALAKHLGIEISCDVLIPSNLSIQDYDLCTLFGNSVDNAIKAASIVSTSKKWIDIKAKPSGGFFIIDIINSCDKNYRTTGRGYGIPNIKAVAQNLGGTAQTEEQNNTFRITILLPQK